MGTPDKFNALLLEQTDGKISVSIKELIPTDLPAGDVTITVIQSESSAYKPGDQVILTGWGVGERHWGGYSQLARVKSDWLVPLPAGMTTHQSMAIGTAGLTSMLCVQALENQGIKPGGEVVVTGAAGGVGSVAVALLARLGYSVVASTGRAESHEYLKSLGASAFLDRSALGTPSERPMESERWAGAVDTVGGDTLASVIKAMSYGGSVAACGLAGGTELKSTVFPFILRGVNLLGIDSVNCPTNRRIAAWKRLSQELPSAMLDAITTTVGLGDVPKLADQILKGQVQGRVVVDVNR
jgi:acrylyl-CoA reductase (NADPH)